MDSHALQAESLQIFLDFKDTPWREKGTIMWGWCWRGFLVWIPTAITVVILSALIGGILGLVMGILRINPGDHLLIFQIVGGTIGIIVGFASLYPFILWITKCKIGKYQFRMFIIETKTSSFEGSDRQ